MCFESYLDWLKIVDPQNWFRRTMPGHVWVHCEHWYLHFWVAIALYKHNPKTCDKTCLPLGLFEAPCFSQVPRKNTPVCCHWSVREPGRIDVGKKSHSSIFFGPLWVLYPVWPTPIYSHLLKWLSPISVDIRSASATNRECCGWVVPSDWNLWRVGSFGRLDLRQFSWDFLGPNLSIWNGHISQNPFSIGYRPFPLTIRNQRRSVVHALPGCPSCQRRARVLGASFLGGTRVRPPMSSYDHHFQPESRFGTCFCSVWQLTSGR